METTPVNTSNPIVCLSESNRIFRANYCHFFALSFLFLPLSLSLIINPTLSLTGYFFIDDDFHKFAPDDQKPLLLHLSFIIIAYVLALCAIATITYSTYHGYMGKPIKFLDAVKSLALSFLPLVWTVLSALLDLFLISLTFLLFVMLGHGVGIVIDYNSLWFTAFIGAMLIPIIVYFLLIWSLALVVVMVESKWGFEALIRSSYLAKGMRSASLSLLAYFGPLVWCTVFAMSNSLRAIGISSYALVPMTLGSIMLTWFFVWSTAANTVLYMYCKDFLGEPALDIAEGSAHDYINLPSDDQKVPHVITVVEA